jgi:hypothetical protein
MLSAVSGVGSVGSAFAEAPFRPENGENAPPAGF